MTPPTTLADQPTDAASAGGADADHHRPSLDVSNPASGEVVRTVPVSADDEVAATVAAARAAQPAWRDLGFDGRARVLDRFRQRLSRHRDLVLDELQAETGKPREDAQADLTLVVSWAKWWADHAQDLLADETVRPWSPFVAGRKHRIVYEPRGVVGVIGPWNVPLSLTVGDALPALMAGNAVVIKPSEVTPLSVLIARRFWIEAGGPPDVLGGVVGAGDVGAALVDEVDFVMFTGSVATGKRVAARAVERLVPYSLELGGKDPMVVLADANLQRAANAAAYYALFNAGQVCMSVERVYVEDAVHDQFVDLVVEAVSQLRQGRPGDLGSVDLGAVIHPPQAAIVRSHLDDAVARGARVLTGGQEWRGPGHFLSPTVLVDVDHTMACMREETFGPTLPIMRVADAEEAIRLANDSPYGLTASVWTSDVQRGEAIARRIEAGTVTVNDALTHLAAPELPFGGWKQSGLGVRNGAQGIRKYCTQKVVQVNRLALDRDVHWYPYQPRSSRVVGTLVGALYGRPAFRPLSSRPAVALGDAVSAARNGLGSTLRRLLP